jgi:hypothetical protein
MWIQKIGHLLIPLNNFIPQENIIETHETLNGVHIVTKPFDTRELTKKFEAPLVEVKKDALLFVASFRVE